MGGLADLGLLAIMSTAAFDARNTEELECWLRACNVPAHLSRASARQVHGARIVSAREALESLPEADGLWTDDDSIALLVRIADCAPVWLADERSPRRALLHAGWRGLASGIIRHAVNTLVEAGTNARHLRIAIGPHLQPCCCEIGPEVAAAFSEWPQALRSEATLRVRSRADAVALDMAAVAIAQARAAGVPKAKITASSACTRCRPDAFHSYRRNGAGGPLMAAVAVCRMQPV
jgi:YfiH family protein